MKISQLFETNESCPHCGGSMTAVDEMMEGPKDACYYKIKASSKVWPSAYASGRLVQCRKKGAASYGNKSEGVAEGARDRRDAYQKDYDSSVSGMDRRPNHGDDERHDLDPSDWYIVKDRKMYKTSVYPNQEREATRQGYSSTREEAKAKADDKGMTEMDAAADPTIRPTDLGNGFVLTTINFLGNPVKAVLDTESDTSVIKNLTSDGFAMIRSSAKFLSVKDGKIVGTHMDVGPLTKSAMQKAGLLESVNQVVAEESDELARVMELSGLNLTVEEQFDMIELMVESLAESHGVDAETIWEDFESVDDDELLSESAAWRNSSGKSKKGGLNAKGVASYRRENPGSKLQMAVTTKPSKLKPGSKAAKRRKSFCARMGGNKGPMKKPNGDPTRKALALRKWNC